MKKLLAILLCLATVFSLAACGEKDDDSSRRKDKKKEDSKMNFFPTEEGVPDMPEPVLSNEPTEEDYALLSEYAEICYELYYYDVEIQAETEPGVFVSGPAALVYYYDRLSQMGAIDRWLETDYLRNTYYYFEEIPTNRMDLLNKFYFVDDVKLSYLNTETTDNLGNVTHYGEDGTWQGTTWEYNTNGEISRVENEELQITPFHYLTADYRFESEYQEGKLHSRRYFDFYGDVVFELIYQYDGHTAPAVVEQRHNTSSEYYEFSFDEFDRVIQVRWEDYMDYTIDYVYDDQGRLIQESYSEWQTFAPYTDSEPLVYLHHRIIHDYTYDEKGHLTTGTFTENNYINLGRDISSQKNDTVDYTTDNQGRVLKEVVTYGPTISHPGTDREKSSPSSVSTSTYEYTYGLFCGFLG